MADTEIKSLMTLSSKSEGSLHSKVWLNPPLHERCTMNDMESMRQAFLRTYMGKMFPDVFRETLRELLNVEYDDEEFNILFLKINTSRTGEIDWDEFVSHLLLGYFTNDPEHQRETLEPPIIGLPRVMRSKHRHPISRITFCPVVDKHRRTDWMLGNYITASRDGQINTWSLDMQLLRTAYSSSPHLKVRTTWVTDLVCMPDVSIIVTSSTERDLRFYDCTAKTFTLKIIITSWEFMICTMYYHFHKNPNENSMLLCGDVGGNVRVLLFSPLQRGPFQSQAARAFIQLRHIDLQKRPQMLPLMTLVEFQRVHNEWVRQVSFYSSLHCVVSCATCPDSLLMCDIAGTKTSNMFHVEKGIQCFAFDEEAHVLVTGGPDCTVRLWNPFVPTKPTLVLTGHHAGIIALVIQNQGATVYSLSRDRVTKVWDVPAQCVIQNYIDIPAYLGERTPISAVYNPSTRDFILGAVMIAMVVLNEQLNPKHTDGYTHARAVSKILYNTLFKVVVTCGMDSIIINWDPKTGKRNVMIRDAHTRLLHGEEIPVEITAACFDPGNQALLTGARDGTLKIWNFNNGECKRNMHVERDQEITGVFWIEGRIFCIGWNRHVTEFQDEGTEDVGKPWETRHTDDVMAAVARAPLTLATASYNSELIFWKLETGQPFRRFSCTEPMLRIKMMYNKRDVRGAGRRRKSPETVEVVRHRSPIGRPNCMQHLRETLIDPVTAMAKAHARRSSPKTTPPRVINMRQLAIHAMIFLVTRPFTSQEAPLMVSLENGQIQAWSDHPAGGLRGAFQAVHAPGDYVSALATDVENKYLFTGTTVGYVKVWLMENYLRTEDAVHAPGDYVSALATDVENKYLFTGTTVGYVKVWLMENYLRTEDAVHAPGDYVSALATDVENKYLFTGTTVGYVKVWLMENYLRTEDAVHAPGDYVSALATDVENKYLFTGTTVGYVKVWLMENYLRTEEDRRGEHLSGSIVKKKYLWEPLSAISKCGSWRTISGQKSVPGGAAPGDYMSALATDVDNKYLFTGTTVGYVKVWLMENYLRTEELQMDTVSNDSPSQVHVNMPALRLQFPFLWKDRIEGRAKRAVRDQPLPVLLNSGSSDYSVRMWRLSGEYMQTLGGIVPWNLDITRLPPDVRKVASFTTFKVWRGGWYSRYTPGQVEPDIYGDITDVEMRKVYGKPAEDPILGHYFKLPKRPDHQDPIKLDDSLPTIPLYRHLHMARTVPVRRPATPPMVRDTRLKKERERQDAKKAHFGKQQASASQHSVEHHSPPHARTRQTSK
ncbi:hypothetical protein NE865_14118 [Phthorimaea operculella]|nr:hypothetical protein NE865_14118 [Phthorimaea operculella]